MTHFESFKRNMHLAKRMDIYRSRPQTLEGIRVDGYQLSLPPDLSIASINQATSDRCGGGAYRVILVADDGKILSKRKIYLTGDALFSG